MKTYSSQLNSGIIQLKRIAEGDKIKDELSIEQNQESTKTTVNRFESILGKHRIRPVDILNDSKRLEREKIITLFESLSKVQSPTIFIDFGAAESGRDVIKILTEGKGEESLNLMGKITK